MSLRNIEAILAPTSVALVGASDRVGTVGGTITRNLTASGFGGSLYLVNPRCGIMANRRVYASLHDLPQVPDLCVIATPAETLPALIREAGELGVRGVVVISAGFAETHTSAAQDLQTRMLEEAGTFGLRIVGPNCLGIMVPGIGLNASFAHRNPASGTIAFISQSGAVATAVLDWAAERNIGFSHLISVGDMADVDFGDLLDYLALDAATHAILLYMESVTDARKFMSAGRAAARLKPVIVVKAGRHAESAAAAASHTGALAGADAAYQAAFRRAGMLRVYELDALFDAAQSLALARTPSGDRLAILTNGGGAGVMAVDALLDGGGVLASLSRATLERLDGVLPKAWSQGNPVDLIGDANGDRYANAFAAVAADPRVDAVLVLHCPVAVTSPSEVARAVANAAQTTTKCVLASWLGDRVATEGAAILTAQRIPCYATPEGAVRSFIRLVEYGRNQQLLMRIPPSVPQGFVSTPDVASSIAQKAVAENREWLLPDEVEGVLSAFAIPLVRSERARTAAEAAEAAKRIGGPVALKIVSPDLLHKSDVGGVILNLATPEAVAEAARAMELNIRRTRPGTRIEGWLVQPMAKAGTGYELIIGAREDRQFGPLIVFGRGGTEVELLADTVVELPPLNMLLASEMIGRTRVARLLAGYRGRPAADTGAIALTLMKVSQLLIDVGEVVEFDINPLVADAEGVVALDARIRVRGFTGTPESRLAIRPYPRELEEVVESADGRTLLIRPIVAEDEPAFLRLFSMMTAEDIRMRFFAPSKVVSHPVAARLTQIDYDREMGFILTEPGPPGNSEVYAAIHLAAAPRGEAEFAITVRSDLSGRGYGGLLMAKTIRYARQRRLRLIFGEVLRENVRMLALCRDFGFDLIASPEERGRIQARLELRKDCSHEEESS